MIWTLITIALIIIGIVARDELKKKMEDED